MSERSHALAYEIDFDLVPESLQLDRRTIIKTNIEKALGEAFNCQMSQVVYRLRNGKLIPENSDEPFEESIKRGIERRKNYANQKDRARERAELEGFLKIQEIFTNPHRSRATKVMSISAKGDEGTDYPLNFFDIFEQLRDGTILMTRYSSKMTRKEFRKAARTLDPSYNSHEDATDAFLLANPVNTFRSSEEILSLFHKDENAMPSHELKRLVRQISTLRDYYVDSLKNGDRQESLKRFKAIFNLAADILENEKLDGKIISLTAYLEKDLGYIVDVYSSQPLRVSFGGCGKFEEIESRVRNSIWGNSYRQSAAELGSSTCGECGGENDHFHCPRCHGGIENGRGITTCPHCHLTKEEAGSTCA